MIERDLYAIELYANGMRLLRARRKAGLPCRVQDRHEALIERVEGVLTARVGTLPLAPVLFFLVFAVAVLSLGIARP
jgi:hypothetical protein